MAQSDAVARLDGIAPPGHNVPIEGDWWLAWNADPGLLIGIGLAAFVYLRGLRLWTDRTHPHSPWRTASFLGGLGVLLLAIESPIDRLGEHHFAFHMLQHELLMMVVPPLLLLGAPTTPMLRGLPAWARRGVVRPLAASRAVHRAFRWLTHPLVAIALLTFVMWWWHLAPGWYERANLAALPRILTPHPAEMARLAGIEVAGLLFWWNVIDPHPLRSRIPHLPRIFYVFAGAVPKDGLAALIVFSDRLLYPAYAEAEPIFDLSLEDDQVLGGMIMWIGGDAVHVVAVIAIFLTWYQRMRVADAREEANAARL